jgi:hypothetical protein
MILWKALKNLNKYSKILDLASFMKEHFLIVITGLYIICNFLRDSHLLEEVNDNYIMKKLDQTKSYHKSAEEYMMKSKRADIELKKSPKKIFATTIPEK